MAIMILPLTLVSTIFFFVYLYFKLRQPTRKTLVPAGPRGLPIIGNLHQLYTAADMHVYLWRLSHKYGPLMRLNLGPKPLLVVSSAELAKQVFKTQDLAFSGRPLFLGQQKLSYNGLDVAFAPYGEYWREVRKIMATHLLSARKIQSFRPERANQVQRMIEEVSGFASARRAVNLSEMTLALGSTLICQIAFGRSDAGKMRRFDELLHEAQALMATFFVSDYFPAFAWVDRVTGLTGRLDRAFGRLDSFYQEVIDEHVGPKGWDKEGCILDTLIRLKEEKSCSVDMNWDNIKALLMDIFIGATDTSATSIVWTMTALMKEPHIMQKVQAEIRNTIGNKGTVDEDDLPKLPYLKAVINETFRLYPAAPMLVPHETIEKCTLEGYEIQPETMVYVNAWAIARDPEYWENPNEFVPERFLKNNINIRGQCFGVVPFGSGRRMCPGMSMGLANVELVVANLLYSFDWEFPPGIEAKDIDSGVLRGLVMHKKNPLLLVPNKYVGV